MNYKRNSRIFLAALAGCSGHSAVKPEPRIVRAEVAVPVLCKIGPVAVPPWAAAGLKKTDSLEVKVRALLTERRQRKGYERELLVAQEAFNMPLFDCSTLNEGGHYRGCLGDYPSANHLPGPLDKSVYGIRNRE